jgi:hypothetical protein
MTDGQSRLHHALFVRDICDLNVASAESPPKAHGTDAQPHLRLDPTRSAAVAVEWLSWWRELVNLQVRLHDTHSAGTAPATLDRGSLHGFTRELADRYGLTLRSWDEQAWLAGRPALAEAVSLASLRFSAATDAPPCAKASYEAMKSVAKELISERQVQPDQVKLLFIGLPVPGTWWHLWSPGVVLVAEDTLRSGTRSRAILRNGYSSAL